MSLTTSHRRATCDLMVLELAAMEDRLGELVTLAPETGFTSLVTNIKWLKARLAEHRGVIIKKRDTL